MNKTPESNDPTEKNEQPADAADLTEEELSSVIGGLGITIVGTISNQTKGGIVVNGTFR